MYITQLITRTSGLIYRNLALVAPECQLVVRKFVIVNTPKYPLLSVRLSPTMKRRIEQSALMRNSSQGRIVREALKTYFVGSEKIDKQF